MTEKKCTWAYSSGSTCRVQNDMVQALATAQEVNHIVLGESVYAGVGRCSFSPILVKPPDSIMGVHSDTVFHSTEAPPLSIMVIIAFLMPSNTP